MISHRINFLEEKKKSIPVPRRQTLNSSGLAVAGCFDRGENGDAQETGGRPDDASLPDPLGAEHTVIESGHTATVPAATCVSPPPPPTYTHAAFASPSMRSLAAVVEQKPQMSYLWAIFPRCVHIIIKR